jgi:hypothetical protein
MATLVDTPSSDGVKTRKAEASISIDNLDPTTAGRWRDFSGIEGLVFSLGLGPDRQPARAWVERHRQEIELMPTRIVPMAPTIAVEVIRRGGRVELDVQGASGGSCAPKR